ncbi:MAG: hypothetical protein LBB88_10780 [Planctomycetaceae bacterium]|jgi:hypothetical protein|nr:hypothetical protein [Planctomycetaceae bacterium]
MSKQFFYGLFIFLAFSGTVALSANVPDTLNVTAQTSPDGNIIAAVSVQNPFSESWASITLKGEYTGSPAHNNTEEIPGTKKYWKAKATCNGVVFVIGNNYYNNEISYDWQASSDFNFWIKSTTAAKYTITFSLYYCVGIYKKKNDGNAGDFIRWSPIKTVTTTRDIWIVGIDKIMVKPTNSPDTSYIDSPDEVVALVGTQHTFKVIRTPSNAPAWPSGKPKWTLISFNENNQRFEQNNVGDVMYISAADGITLLDSTLTFECGNKKTIKLINIKPILESVDFQGNGIQKINEVGDDPEWQKTNKKNSKERNEPICVVKNNKFQANSKISMSNDLTFQTDVSIFVEIGNTTKTFGKHRYDWKLKNKGTFDLIILDITVENMVYIGTSNYDFYYNVNNKKENMTVFTNTAYVTWDFSKLQDARYITKRHLQYACRTANGSKTLAEIGDKIGADIMSKDYFKVENDNTYRYSRYITTDHPENQLWLIVDHVITMGRASRIRARGDCGAQAQLMKKIIELLGDDSAKIAYVFPRHNSWDGLAHESHNEVEQLGFGYVMGSWNNYEGCCIFQNKWWMGGFGKSQDNALKVLLYVTMNNKDKGYVSNAEGILSDNGNRQCWETNQNRCISYPPGQPTASQLEIKKSN